ncbi:FMN-binding protein [Actinomadura atramentaria]|uniref:FMN-binding protein n=1 Tax=Actinomadura atramentaria TaxID=1990 RepID=UPI00036BE764|nr:FMN-binding protein [Actinomadura atramentaria]
MRRILLSTGTTAAGIAALVALKPGHTAAPAATPTASGAASGAASGPAASPTTSAASGSGVSGTFTGDPAETPYGPVQVQITMKDGKLTKATVLQVPSEHGPEREIVEFDVPRLNAAAVAAGSARIDTISGATYTSEGYRTSLQSALDRAGA